MKKTFLITGAQYSATTLVGKIIANSSSLNYIHEPFSHRTWAPYWFMYINDNNCHKYARQISEIIHLRPKFFTIFSVKDLFDYRIFARKLLYMVGSFRARLNNTGIVIKDPNAVLLCDWLSTTYNIPVVATIRHPCAFVESFVRKKSHHPFSHFLKQSQLMKNCLAGSKDKICCFANSSMPLIDQGALIWFILNSILLKYAQKNPLVKVFRHEDIARSPLEEFKKIYVHIGEPYTSTIEENIMPYFNMKNSIDAGKVVGGLNESYVKRNPVESINKWKKRLTLAEIETIKNYTGSIANSYY